MFISLFCAQKTFIAVYICECDVNKKARYSKVMKRTSFFEAMNILYIFFAASAIEYKANYNWEFDFDQAIKHRICETVGHLSLTPKGESVTGKPYLIRKSLIYSGMALRLRLVYSSSLTTTRLQYCVRYSAAML